jgi:FkbM family methyltransferase
MRIGADPLDEDIADSVTRRHRAVYFPPEFAALSPRLVVDVGAHHGFYTLGALFEYPGSQVIALEPTAAAVQVLRRNVEINGCIQRVRIEQQAIGTGHEAMRLHLDATGSWGHSLIHVDHEDGTELVRQTPLVEVLDGRVPDVIKCNAEGGEAALVDGLAELGHLPPALVLMIHPQLIDAPTLWAKTRSLGYHCTEAVEGSHPVWICTL